MNLRHDCTLNTRRLKDHTNTNPSEPNPKLSCWLKNTALGCNFPFQSVTQSKRIKIPNWWLESLFILTPKYSTLNLYTCEIRTDSIIFILTKKISLFSCKQFWISAKTRETMYSVYENIVYKKECAIITGCKDSADK